MILGRLKGKLLGIGVMAVALLTAGAQAGVGPDPTVDKAAIQGKAASLLETGARNLFAGHPDEARTALAEAATLYRQLNDRHGEAVCLIFQSMSRAFAGEYGAAMVGLEQSQALLEAEGDRFSASFVLLNMAELEKQRGSFGAAIARLEQSLSLLADLEASPEPLSPTSLILWARGMGALEGLNVDVLKAALPFIKTPLLQAAEASMRDSYGSALAEMSRFEEAETQLTKAAELSRLQGGMLDPSVHAHFGDLYRRQWRFEEARASYEKALASLSSIGVLPAMGFNPQEIYILQRMAEIEFLLGRMDQAVALQDRALDVVRRGQNPSPEVAVLKSKAMLFVRAGRFKDAERALLDAESIAERAAQPYLRALVLADQGSLWMLQGDYESAARLLESAEKQLQQVESPEARAGVLILLSQVYMAMGSRGSAADTLHLGREIAGGIESESVEALLQLAEAVQKRQAGEGSVEDVRSSLFTVLGLPEVADLVDPLARKLFLEILDAGARPGESGSVLSRSDLEKIAENKTVPYLPALARAALGGLLLKEGKLEEARAKWAPLESSGILDFEVGARAAAGASYWKEGRKAEAIGAFSAAVDLLEKAASTIQVEDVLTFFLGHDRRWYSEILIEILAEQGKVEDSFLNAERSRARALLRSLGNRRLKASAGADAGLLAEAENLRLSMAGWERELLSATPDRRSKVAEDLRHARERYEQLMVRLKVSNPEYASLTSVEPLRRQEIQKEIPPDATLINYFVTPSKVHAWVLDRTTFRYAALPMAPADLQQAVCWADEVGRTRGARPLDSSCIQEGNQSGILYDKLVAPLVKHIRHRRLILVPHAELHYVPFAALRNPKTGRYLIEDYTLTYLPSPSVLPFLRRKESPVNGRALVLGDPAPADPELEPLPEAGKEAEAVARLFGVRPLLNTQATEARLHDLKGEVDLLHIAAHGLYDPRSPLFSRITLAPEGGYDGNLEVHEIFSDLDLDGVNLVVLSACRTAAGERSGADEITGLTRAFLYAGSPGVISTLWDIDDKASSLLMEDFYRRLRSGDSAAAALRQAQIRLLRNPKYQAPYYWAAFSLTGDPQGRWKRTAR